MYSVGASISQIPESVLLRGAHDLLGGGGAIDEALDEAGSIGIDEESS